MNQQLKRLLIFFSISLNIGFLIMAGINIMGDDFKGRHGPSFTKKYQNWMNHLDLTRDQRDRLKPLTESYIKETRELRKKSLTHRINSFKIIAKKGQADMPALKSERTEIEKIEGKKEALRQHHMLEFKEVLTEKQSEKFFSEIIHHLESKR